MIEPTRTAQGPTGDTLPAGPVLRVEDAAMRFGDRVLWGNLSFDVEPGEFVAVLGANGSGKTTLLKAILGQQQLSQGRIEFLGEPVRRGNRQIGYVPRGGALLPHLTVRQNIEYLVWRQESVREIVRGWAATLIYQLELGPVLEQRPHEITAQQRMRGALARAVVSMPEALGPLLMEQEAWNFPPDRYRATRRRPIP